MQPKSWYRSWFDSPYYHLLYHRRDEREAAQFIDRLLRYFGPKPESHFLDLPCGRGRHSLHIHKRGFQVTGLDLAPKNIAQASESAAPGLTFDVHDMREPYRTEGFDFVLNLFTSFGYFSEVEQNMDVLRAAWTNLKPKGKLLIDFLNAEPTIRGLRSAERIEIDGIVFEISRHFRDGTISKTIEVTDGAEVHTFEENVLALRRPEFSAMLRRAGFEILDSFGNYALESYNADSSSRLILVARKVG